MVNGKIKTLYADRENQEAVFPRTKVNAISDENGVGLNMRLKNAAPHNLLDNSDFRNPVNQRGQASYNSDGYCFDRWIIYRGDRECSVSYDSSKKCIRIVAESTVTLYQRLPKGVLDRNKKYTQAFGLTDGRTIIGTRIDYSPENYDSIEGIVINNGQAEIVWTALYEGEYTAETLPEYQPKGYGVELAECLRYYRVLIPNGLDTEYPCMPYGDSATLTFTFDIPMRVTPSIVGNPLARFVRTSDIGAVLTVDNSVEIIRGASDTTCFTVAVRHTGLSSAVAHTAIDLANSPVPLALSADL